MTMSERRIIHLILCLVVPGIAVFGAGCLDGGDGGAAVTDPGIEASYEVAEADAREALTRTIEEELADSPLLANYSVDYFYDGSPLTMVGGSGMHPGTEDAYYVFNFRHEMPSLKDPVNVRDEVTITIVVQGGEVSERMIGMGSVNTSVDSSAE